MQVPRNVRLAVCSLLLASGVGLEARAAMIYGTFGFVPLGNVTYSGPDLGDATSLGLPEHGLINTIPDSYNGNPNDFSAAGAAVLNLLSQVDLSSLVLPLTGVVPAGDFLSFSADTSFASGTTPSDRYDFDLQTLTKTSSGSSSLNLSGTGVLVDTIHGFANTPALLSLALTQSAPGGAINVSFSLATAVVPEPGTVGAAAAALAMCVLLAGCFIRLARATANRQG